MGGFFENVIINLLSGIILAILLFLLDSSLKFRRLLYRIINLFKGKLKADKMIFIWNDSSPYISEKIISDLKHWKPQYQYIALNEPDAILNYWLNTKGTQAVIFIVSDVTKLSNDNKTREIIQKSILNYVSKGGLFIGTHDIIYRRTDNEKFQISFGCRINKFQTVNIPVGYEINPEFKDHRILEGLPTKFSMEDNEVCWGEWAETSYKLVMSEKAFNKNETVPLVVFKECGEGGLLWLNSGDKSEQGICESINKPDRNLIKLISNAISFVEK